MQTPLKPVGRTLFERCWGCGRSAWRLLATALFAAAAAENALGAAADGGRWEQKIRQYEEEDAAGKIPPGRILFVGSSSITRWKLDAYFPRTDLVNRGFGGSLLEEVAALAERYITPLRPRQIVVYAGENDLASGRTPEQVLAAYRILLKKIRAALPETPILFISLKPSPSRQHLRDAMRETNRLIAEETQRNKHVTFVDVFTPMLGEKGELRPDLYVNDRLHLSHEGYRLWAEILTPLLAPEASE